MVIKAREPFLGVRKMMRSILNLEVGRQTGALAIFEVTAPPIAIQKKLPS